MISSERASVMSNHPRRILTPGVSRKRKERDDFDALKPSTTTATKTTTKAADPPASSNRLLAGYLAHEFLTQGTLFGNVWDPALAGTVPPVSSSSAGAGAASGAESSKSVPETVVAKNRRYAEVASLMKTDGAHIPGIVNPTQLARLLKM